MTKPIREFGRFMYHLTSLLEKKTKVTKQPLPKSPNKTLDGLMSALLSGAGLSHMMKTLTDDLNSLQKHDFTKDYGEFGEDLFK
jgi:predicted CDP-diglyceride synthetase/phosphatidate cytidylyltransferase